MENAINQMLESLKGLDVLKATLDNVKKELEKNLPDSKEKWTKMDLQNQLIFNAQRSISELERQILDLRVVAK